MSFRLFIYYCALCGGWAALFGWLLGLILSPAPTGRNAIGIAGIKGMWLGMMIALALSLVDCLWNLSLRQLGQVIQRVGVAVLVGCVGGLLGGIIGQWLLDTSLIFFVVGWVLTGLLVGTSVGVFEMLSSVIRQQEVSGARKKLLKGLVGGTIGGVLGGTLALLLLFAWRGILKVETLGDLNPFWSPFAYGFVALGMSIGLFVGLAQVILKEAWIKIESGRRAGREMILNKERTTVGRAEKCDILLLGDNQIEREHARIVLMGSRYFIEDNGTPAGTYVNNQRVMGRTPLQSGDMIQVGNSVLCFREKQKRSNGQM
ncbi:MAG: FHA domain-containing protein [Gemmataceae bacterium]|nr:FHA domain-containing protein [Gemmataceae bacterium]